MPIKQRGQLRRVAITSAGCWLAAWGWTQLVAPQIGEALAARWLRAWVEHPVRGNLGLFLVLAALAPPPAAAGRADSPMVE